MTPLVRMLVLVLSVCAGFLVVRPLTSPARIAATTSHTLPAAIVPIDLPPLTAAGSTLIAEWEQLRGQHGSETKDFSALYLELKDQKDPFRRRAFSAALIAEWARTNPLAAIAFLQEKEWSDAFLVTREWFRRDPQAAIDGLLAADEKTRVTLISILGEIAKRTPTRLVEAIAVLPESNVRSSRIIEDAFAVYAQKDLVAARIAAESIMGPLRGKALAGIAQAWAEKDGPAALGWAQAMAAGEARGTALKAALTGYAKADPLAALEKIDLVPPGGEEMRSDTDVGALVLREAITRDWNGTLTWLREHPGKLGINSLDGMSDVIARRLGDDPAGTLRALAQDGMPDLSQLLSNTFVGDGYGQHDAVWQWLDQQPESDFTRKTRDALLYAMGWTDPDTAVAYLEKLPDTAENRQSFERAMRSLLGYRQKDRFEDLFAKASPKLRPYLLASGFTSVAAQGNIDPAIWLPRLDELPADQRLKALGGVARGWAVNDPQAAIDWATSLTDAAQRSQAIDGAVTMWATVDVYSSSQWINSLPSGEARDSAVQGLVRALTISAPEDAWTWALSVQASGNRLSALQVAYTGLTKRDPARAQQFLQSADLSADEIAAVQQPPQR